VSTGTGSSCLRVVGALVLIAIGVILVLSMMGRSLPELLKTALPALVRGRPGGGTPQPITVVVTATPASAEGQGLVEATVKAPSTDAARPSPTRTAPASAQLGATPTGGPPRAVVTGDTLNLRTGPGTSFPKIEVLKKGDALLVTGRTKAGDWLEVLLPDGTKGWVSASLVKLEVPVTGVAVAKVIPKPPTPAATRTPAPPQPTLTVDEQIAKVAKGQHGTLPQPGEIGGVAAGGEAEVTIINDTPNTLTVLVGSPSSVSITIEPCPSCRFYSLIGPAFCPEAGRPKKTVRLKPGTSKVVARVNDQSVTPFYGTWEMKPDTGYLNCFFIVTR